MNIIKDKRVMNAIYIGTLCSVAYLAVYFARNILSAVTPQMIEGGYTEEYIGRISFVYFAFYAVGQLINGAIGDKIKARYMISTGLFLSGITNLLFCNFVPVYPDMAVIIYGLTGFFLAMIYGPMTKVVAENRSMRIPTGQLNSLLNDAILMKDAVLVTPLHHL